MALRLKLSEEQLRTLRSDVAPKIAIDHGEYDWDGLASGVRSAKARGCATDRDVADVDDKTLRPARMDEILTCLLNKAGDGRPGPKREKKDRP